MIALELFHGERERLGQRFECNIGDLFVSLFVLLLAHYTKILDRTRVIETNLLLSSPVSSCYQLWVPQCVVSEGSAVFVGHTHSAIY